MAVAPALPKLAPKDMQWIRWVTAQLGNLENNHNLLRSNLNSAVTQSNATQAAAATVVQTQAESLTINVPTGAPQVPSGPLLFTERGTVTITWDGTVYASVAGALGNVVSPAIGFNRVNVYRATDSNGPFTLINYISNGSTSIVDATVVVGTTYYYRFITIDNLGMSSDPGPTSTVLVKGVDLGNLAADVKNAISAAANAGQAGQDAANIAAAAAQTADAKAASALNSSSVAQQRADDAYASAQATAGVRQVYIGNGQPADSSGTVLWIDTTNDANTPKRFNGSVWLAVTDKSIVDAANAAVQAKNVADAARVAADNALNVANNAANLAGTAQNTANGKNKVNYSTNTPTGNGAYGDVWFQYRDSILIGQWFFDGTYWQPKQIDSQVIGNLDAGKITSGVISADRIGANSISAVKMVAGTITADSGILSDAVITTAKIADAAVSSAKIASLDAAKIQAGTITADKFAAGAISASTIAAGSIDTNRLAAGAVTTAKLNATAIDGMTITGAVFRTSGTATTTGVVMDSSGIRAYQNNNQTFYADSNGNVSMVGYVNATGGNFTGNINAQSGTIAGDLTVNGKLIAGNSTGNGLLYLDSDSLRVNDSNGRSMFFGATSNLNGQSAYTTALRWGATNADANNWYGKITWSNSDRGYGLDMRGASNVLLLAGQADLNIGNDGSGGQIWSNAIRSRTYSTANRTASDGNRIMVITPYGTLGALTGVINSNYTSSSSRRFKHDIEDWRPDVRTLLELNPVRFKYNDGDGKYHVGMIAEQMAELGFDELVSRNDDGDIQTIEYLVFGSALLHVAREQQKTIDNLEQRLMEAGI